MSEMILVTLDEKELERLKMELFSFNFRISFPNIDCKILELQWNSFFPSLNLLMEYLGDELSQKVSLEDSGSPSPSP